MLNQFLTKILFSIYAFKYTIWGEALKLGLKYWVTFWGKNPSNGLY